MGAWDFLTRWWGRSRDMDPAALEALRREHQERCRRFKLLIAANNGALEVMADLEEVVRSGRLVDESFLRDRSIRVLTQVHQLLEHYAGLGGVQAEVLSRRYQDLRARMVALLESPGAPEASGPLVLPLERVGLAQAPLAGWKMARLGQAGQGGWRVPPGFVITSAAFRRFMGHGGLDEGVGRVLQEHRGETWEHLEEVSRRIDELIMAAPLPPELGQELAQAVEALATVHPGPLRLAARSSALDEDAAEASFAGQYRTVLEVAPEGIEVAYRQVVASLYGVEALAYRLHRGLSHQGAAMCVGVMPMIEALAGGVLYTRDPRGGQEDRLLVSVVRGLPVGAVDGTASGRLYALARSAPHRAVLESPAAGDIPDLAQADLEQRLGELARLALDLERETGGPLDVEWALDDQKRLWLLQCRPLTGLGGREVAQAEPGPGVRPLAQGGQTASPGAAVGPVAVVRGRAEALAFPAGAVLVVEQALPRWAPLLGRAAALVGERGSATGHLANVARELKVPALLDFSGATTILPEGRQVTVDATRRAVYLGELPIRRPEPETQAPAAPANPLALVAEELARIATHLNLTDPQAPEFRAESCQSLHDLTRFCHENAVRAMFQTRRALPVAMSRQLYHQAPMQYWVIDLGGALAGDPGDKYVRLGEINCPPFMALWRGLTAFPPPSLEVIDGAGLLNVMLRAGGNAEMGGGLSRPSEPWGNYFMLSPEFCHLQSRFGVHFCTVEALVGPEADLNYLSFRFKGGAADPPRRRARVRMLAELLEEVGFTAEGVEDVLNARVEGAEAAYLHPRLAVLGYLLLHACRLDMVMANPAQAAAQRRRLAGQMAQVLTLPGEQP